MLERAQPGSLAEILPSGRELSPQMSDATTAITPTADNEYAMPLAVGRATEVDRLGIYIATPAAGALVRLGIRAAGADGLPDTVLVDAGTIDGSVAGPAYLPVAVTVPGLSYLVAAFQGTAVASVYGWVAKYSPILPSVNVLSGAATCYSQAGVAGALPAAFAATDTAQAPQIAARVA